MSPSPVSSCGGACPEGGSERRGKISKAGPSMLRWWLNLAADTARTWDLELAELYRRLMAERGRHHNQALCAVAPHLVGLVTLEAATGSS